MFLMSCPCLHYIFCSATVWPAHTSTLTGEDDGASVHVCKIGMYEAFNLEVLGRLGRAR